MGQNIFSWRTGSCEVFMLTEHQGPGNPDILLDTDPALVQKYIPGGNFISGVNVFLVREGKRIVLFDTGFGRHIFDSMKTLGIGNEEVGAVLITHLHGDHFMGLERDGKALFPSADIFLSEKERDSGLSAPSGGPGKSAAAVLAPYGGRVKTFHPGTPAQAEPLLPGVSAIAAYGHTAGHTVYLIESAGEKLLITGDMIHAGAIQFPAPDISVTYDTDPGAARASRREILAWAAAGGIPLGGMHLAYPALGTVRAENGGYHFTPAG